MTLFLVEYIDGRQVLAVKELDLDVIQLPEPFDRDISETVILLK